jgi:tetratricopeptide (TPR) repeat protein
MEDSRLLSTQTIQRAVWTTLAVLVAVLVLFISHYVWDRYIYLGGRPSDDLDIEQAVHRDPRDAEARIALAESYARSGRYADALDQAEQVLGLYPDAANALLIAGISHVLLGQTEAALDPLHGFVALRQDEPMARTDTVLEAAYYYLGESYLKLDRPMEAIPVLEAALLISPTDADALYQLGLAYHASGQPELALQQYHEAVRFVPDFVEAYRGMVESYSALGQPGYEAYARGMEAFSLKDCRTAQPYLEQATETLPDFAPASLGIGLTYECLGQLEAASSAIGRALALDPGDFAAQQAFGRTQAALSSED